jgi:hypothetical protein
MVGESGARDVLGATAAGLRTSWISAGQPMPTTRADTIVLARGRSSGGATRRLGLPTYLRLTSRYPDEAMAFDATGRYRSRQRSARPS